MRISEGQTAVITGAGSGIGKALAQLCAAQGMHVVAADIELAAAQATASEISSAGGQAVAMRVDVSQPDDIKALAELAWKHFGGCHLLCNNAGVGISKPLDQCTPADWQWVLNVNLMGVANAVSSFVPRLKKQGGASHIVNTASMTGLAPLPMCGPYVASKYAVVALSEVLHQELSGTEIGISVLCPGLVETRIADSARNRPDPSDPPPPQSIDAAIDTAYSRMLEPQRVAEITLDAVRQDRLYVLTHAEWQPLFNARVEAINAAFAACPQ